MKPRIKFVNKNQTQFFNVLKERVDSYFSENKISPNANSTMVLKSLFMLALYFVPYFLIMTQGYSLLGMWLLTLVMGVGLAGIGMGIMHDANHGAYSSNPIINKLFGLTLSLVGGDPQNWKTQHNVLHHTYTNIYGYDKDIDDKGVMRLTPESKHKKAHRFQVFYVFFFYSLMTLYWTTLKDFVQYFQFIKEGHSKDKGATKVKTFLTIFIWKLFYWGYIMVLPVVLLDLKVWQMLIGFATMHFVAGLLLSVIFQLAHVVEETTFPVPDEKGNIDNEWAIHQLNTTADFARNNWLITFYVGGLNFQAIHHLFPQICHVHYPKIAPIVEQTAKEYGVEYIYTDSFWSALASHIRHISRLGRDEVRFSAIANKMG
jgi:linoleoyl-CoA desaturase